MRQCYLIGRLLALIVLMLVAMFAGGYINAGEGELSGDEIRSVIGGIGLAVTMLALVLAVDGFLLVRSDRE